MGSESHEEIFLNWHDAGQRVVRLGLKMEEDIKEHRREDSKIWVVYMLRGGAVVARLLQGFLKSRGIDTRYLFFGASYYSEGHTRLDEVEVRGLDNLVKYINPQDLVYCIDDVGETLRTFRLSKEHLKILFTRERPHDTFPPHIKLCVLSWKKQKDHKGSGPDLYVSEDDPKIWLKFPWEWEDLSSEQIRVLYGEKTAQLCK